MLRLANHLLIPATTAIYLAAVGSQIRVEPFGQALRPCLAMSAIKFWYTPLAAWLLYLWFRAPPAMVLAAGAAQTLMLPALGAGALWFRYRRCDERMRPGPVWDVMLWLSMTGCCLVASWWIWEKLSR